ncbi:Zwei Ig domain protein zig-8 [Amphibalanus amphitrite]|uniref:Zwei Ig domain protein zig-8 n=1 Tax=Amphibalanus amphitrite TaxID=1232801 RepID=A0A6A4X4T4_AMPAM|nr:Zwei Ig domain protein zig-8 [Amphibalanus amphitrite]
MQMDAIGLKRSVDLNDPSLATDEFWQRYYARLSEQQRPLENNSWVDVTVQSGDRAALSCRVKLLGSRPISWIRRRDFHVLTSRSTVFTNDARFSVQHRSGPVEDWALSVSPVTASDSGVYECQISWIRRRDFHVLTSRSTVFTNDARFSVQHRSGPVEDWALSVSPVTASDSGVYECQVSTGQGTLSQLVNMTVVQPAARILGAEVHRIEEGSDVTILCVIDQAVSDVGAIQWWRDNRSLADSERVSLQSSTSPTPARSPRSQLHVRRATFLDSGLYTCGGPHVQADSVQVMVTEGDKIAAIQRRGGAGSVSRPPTLLVSLLAVVPLLTASPVTR